MKLKINKSAFKVNQVDITSFFLIVCFLADTLGVILNYFNANFTKFSLIVRALFFIHVLFYYLIKHVIPKKSIPITFFILFFFANFLLGYGIYYTVCSAHLFENVTSFFKIIFFFCISIYFLMLTRYHNIDNLYKVYESIVFIVGLSIIIAAVFDIRMLASYKVFRFGYKGFIFAQNEATVFWLIAISYGLKKAISKASYFILSVSIIASSLIGTKTGILLSLTGICYLIVTKVPFRYIISSTACVLFLLLSFSQHILSKAMLYFKELYFFSYYFDKLKVNGLLYLAFSGRNSFIEQRLIPNITENWNIFNWLFGGMDRQQHLVEMDIFDGFTTFGIIGIVVLIFSYIYTFKIIDKKPFFYFMLFFFVTAGLSGHTFTSAMNAMYLCILLIYNPSTNSIVKPKLNATG